VTERAPKPWIPHKPEQRLSIVVGQFLERTLCPPHYVTALHDADGVARTDQSRMRDKVRGVKSGQLDWDVVQGDPLLQRKLELKRGDNKLSENQRVTARALATCGAPPVVAWTLREAYHGLRDAGFRFLGNVETQLQLLDAKLAAMDAEAAQTLAGKPKKKSKSSGRKPPPRNLWGVRAVKRARSSGILI
jgi:hypothetical protein